MLDYIIEEIAKGGWVILPLFVVSVLGWVISFQCIFRVWRRELPFKYLTKRIRYPKTLINWLSNLNPKEKRSFSARVLLNVFRAKAFGQNGMLEALDEQMKATVPEMEKGLETLRILAAAAPLLGLLGTVIGMIDTFNVLSVFGTNNPVLMADSISVALVTTQNGLIVAIPFMLVHIFLTNRIYKIENEINKASHRMINYLTETSQS